MAAHIRAVLDTNVIIAGHRQQQPDSPNAEILQTWRRGEFLFLYSHDIAIEYAEKLLELRVPEQEIKRFLTLLRMLAEWVEIEFFHLPHYPADPDDIAFLLCALNGEASHLVTYDRHLLDFRHHYSLDICRPLDFLNACRQA